MQIHNTHLPGELCSIKCCLFYKKVVKCTKAYFWLEHASVSGGDTGIKNICCTSPGDE